MLLDYRLRDILVKRGEQARELWGEEIFPIAERRVECFCGCF